MNRVFVFFAMIAFAASLRAQPVTPVQLTPHTGFNTPAGIDHHQPTNKVVLSLNYPTGLPHNFELVDVFGNRQQFSNVSGLTEEVKIATARDDGGGMSLGGFTPGELFTGTGVPGHIARISVDGSTVQNPWVVLPGETGLLRGSLHVDRTGIFGGDLIVVTTEPAGSVWRVNSSGVPTKLASLGIHLEGVTTVPNDTVKYGPWAAKILAGAEQQGRVYAIDAQGNTAFFTLGIRPEDIDIIPANENFFGIDFSGQALWTAPPSEFADKVGDILIAQEDFGILFHVRWTGAQFQVTQVAQVGQWEHITFSTSPVTPIFCEVKIVSPAEGALVCDDSVAVTATRQVLGGTPPFTFQCDINGISATGSDSTFAATVPRSPGANLIVATCRVIDSENREFTCSDTVRIFSILDQTSPDCIINFGANSVTGTIVDTESGIAKIEPLFLFNAQLTVDPFTPGDKSVNFRLDDLGLASYIGFDIKITDRCGHAHVCDPVLFQLETDRKDRPGEITFRNIDRYLILTNHGLTKIRVDLNGSQFALLSQPASVAQDLNSYRLPMNGEVTIDLEKYLRSGDNRIRFEFDGPTGARAKVMLIDEAHQIDHALELLPLPEAHQLAQNHPNPFNPTTTIRFSISSRAGEGTHVRLRIYNMLGELVHTLVDETMFPGNYAVRWEGRNTRGENVASGIYIYQLVTEEFRQTKRMIFLR